MEPILDPEYWARRLKKATAERHNAIFICGKDRWEAIEAEHRKILQREIRPNDSILDVGCGWGRLLNLMPTHWKGQYLGIDLSPDFIALARQERPKYQFALGDASILLHAMDQTQLCAQFDVAVLISIRPMIKRNLGSAYWDVLESRIQKMAKRILYLEYDEFQPQQAE